VLLVERSRLPILLVVNVAPLKTVILAVPRLKKDSQRFG